MGMGAGGGDANGAVALCASPEDAGRGQRYDKRDFVDIRFAGITSHVAQKAGPHRRTAIDRRTVRHQGYGQSIQARKWIEQVVGWIKQVAWLRQSKARGHSSAGAVFSLNVVAYNVILQANLLSPQVVLV